MKLNKRLLWAFVFIVILSLCWMSSSSISTVLLGIKGTITDGNLIKFSGTAGVGEDAGVASSNVTKNKFDATTAPTVNNDVDEGYVVGSKWYDVTADKGYVCLDKTDGAAVWIEITSLGTTAFTGLTDTPANYTGEGGKYIKVNVGEDALEFGTVAGEANTASNIGFVADETTAKIYKQKTGVDLELRSLKEGTGIDFTWVSTSGLKISQTQNDNYYYHIYNGGTPQGQYWTAGDTYIIDKIELLLYRTGTGNTVKMQVYAADVNGYPTGGELGSTSVDCTSITTSTSGEWVIFDLSGDSIAITNGNRYCWYLTSTTGDGSNHTTNRVKTADVLANSYIIFNTGTWTHDVATDSAFKIYVSATYYDYVQIGVTPEVGGLLSTTTVAFNADADTTLYTVPTGKRCVLSHAIVVAAGDAGATTTVSIGQNTAETDFIPANTLSNLDAEYDSVILMPIPNTTPLKIKSYAADTVIEAQVASQSGVAGNTIYLFGILY